MDTTKNQTHRPALPRDVERNYVAAVAQAVIRPERSAYQRLVDEFAANAPHDVGYYDVKQLRPLSGAERATVLEANPDIVNDIALEPDELVALLRGQLDPAQWIASLIAGPVRKWLFEDVVDQCERDAQIVQQDAVNPYQRRGDAS